MQARTGSPIHLGAAYEKTAAIVQPALLARGLRRVAAEQGVRIYERTPMVELDREDGVVRTPSGRVSADAIILALNAWATKIPELARAVVAVSSDMVATAPMPEKLKESGWTGGEAISDCRLLVHYYRPTKDGRVAFGRGGGRLAFGGRVNSNFDYNGRQTRELEEELVTLVPAAKDVPVTHAWGGPIDRTTDGLPIVGALPARAHIVYGTGYSGNGVAPSLTVAKMLASSALRRDDEWAGSPFNCGVCGTFPPEPLRFVGGLVVRQAVRHKEGREDQGKSVDPVTKAVAGLAPQGFSAPGAEVAKAEQPVVFFAEPAEMHAWLEEHGQASDGIWLKFAKKGSGLRSVVYAEAVEIALCHGWIDGQVKRLDEQHYLQRFTPRRPRSKWSKLNRNKAERLIAEGRMRPAGLREVERAREDGRWDEAYDSATTATVRRRLPRSAGRRAGRP